MASSLPPRLIEQLRDRIRNMHHSIRTEHAYVDWARRFILFNGKRHPRDLGAAEVSRFLTHLAVHGRVTVSTQSQAKSTLLVLYREVLEISPPWLDAAGCWEAIGFGKSDRDTSPFFLTRIIVKKKYKVLLLAWDYARSKTSPMRIGFQPLVVSDAEDPEPADPVDIATPRLRG